MAGADRPPRPPNPVIPMRSDSSVPIARTSAPDGVVRRGPGTRALLAQAGRVRRAGPTLPCFAFGNHFSVQRVSRR